MKRAAPELSEDKVLLRALRDFNVGKLAADDAAIFAGLLNDLFPRVPETVPRAVDAGFEQKARLVGGVQDVRTAGMQSARRRLRALRDHKPPANVALP